MEKPWFQNKQCLDIGCNEGMITLALAAHFGTASMLGVDIDRKLIGRASRYAAAHLFFGTVSRAHFSRLLLLARKQTHLLCLPVRGLILTNKEQCRLALIQSHRHTMFCGTPTYCLTMQPPGRAALKGICRAGHGIARQAEPGCGQRQQQHTEQAAIAQHAAQAGLRSCAGPAGHLLPAWQLPGTGEPLQKQAFFTAGVLSSLPPFNVAAPAFDTNPCTVQICRGLGFLLEFSNHPALSYLTSVCNFASQDLYKCASAKQDLQAGAFDTITCFSVTKWIHLNGGDEALQALLAKVRPTSVLAMISPGAHTAGSLPQQRFTLVVCRFESRWQVIALQVYALLSPGGRFILEPQQWVSYRKAVRKPVSLHSWITSAVHLAKVSCTPTLAMLRPVIPACHKKISGLYF